MLVVLIVILAVVINLAGRSAALCQKAVVPAYFSTAGWSQAVHTRSLPGIMILDLTSSGAGPSPVPGYQRAVRQAQAAGITVVGYVDTSYGQRPVAEVEANVRDYRAWYGVTDIFLDQVSSGTGQVSYYRALADYVHRVNPGSIVVLNPGVYPDRQYMSIGNIVMVYEGTYSGYVGLKVPGWVKDYPPSRFLNTVYATPGPRLGTVISLSRSRNAGYVYVTNGSAPDPYQSLPSYWRQEAAALASSCTTASAAPSPRPS